MTESIIFILYLFWHHIGVSEDCFVGHSITISFWLSYRYRHHSVVNTKEIQKNRHAQNKIEPQENIFIDRVRQN